jgi:acrylyl-CoA reductase (NADPH)
MVTSSILAQSMEFPASVTPFILLGVTLAGIDNAMAPRAVREFACAHLAQDLDAAQLECITREVGLAGTIGLGAEIRRSRCTVGWWWT